MAAVSAFRVMQHSQIFSLFFRNRIQCIVLYQLHNSQALLNLHRDYYNLALLINLLLFHIKLLAQITRSTYSAGDRNWRICLDKIVIRCSGI